MYSTIVSCAELLADLGPVGVDRVRERRRSCRSCRSPRRPSSRAGIPRCRCRSWRSRVVEVSNSPESSAAAAVTTFIVEPGVIAGPALARLRGAHRLRRCSAATVSLVSLTVLGSNPGTEAMTRTAPVSGSIATTDPPPTAPGVRVDGALEGVRGDALRLGVERERDVRTLPRGALRAGRSGSRTRSGRRREGRSRTARCRCVRLRRTRSPRGCRRASPCG